MKKSITHFCSSWFFCCLWLTALFTNMRILKFKSQLTIALFAAVNHLNGPLRKKNFTLTKSKGQGLWFVIGGFRSVLCVSVGAIHSTKISGNFGPKLNGSVLCNRKSFEKTGPPFEVDHFSRSNQLKFWLNGSRPVFQGSLLVIVIMIDGSEKCNCEDGFWTLEFACLWKAQ